jgi:ABC-2 type transport system permease protein
MVCAGLLFGMLGLITAIKAKTFDQLSAVSTFVILPLTYLGGVFISTETLHPFWKAASGLNPLFYLINGLRFSFMGAADVPLETCAVVAVVALAGMYTLTRVLFKNVTFTRW